MPEFLRCLPLGGATQVLQLNLSEVVEETSIGINPNGTAVKIRKKVEEDVLYLTQCHSSENKERPLRKDWTLVSIHKASSAWTLSLYHMHWYVSISAERPTQGQDDTVSEGIVLSKNTQSWERRLRVRSEISTSPALFKRSKQQQHTKNQLCLKGNKRASWKTSAKLQSARCHRSNLVVMVTHMLLWGPGITYLVFFN